MSRRAAVALVAVVAAAVVALVAPASAQLGQTGFQVPGGSAPAGGFGDGGYPDPTAVHQNATAERKLGNLTAGQVATGDGGVILLGGYGTARGMVLTNATQASERLRISGQEAFQAGNTDTEGLVLKLWVNRTANRQAAWVMSDQQAVNSTNPMLRFFPTVIDSIATDGSTSLGLSITGTPLALNANGAAMTVGGSLTHAGQYVNSAVGASGSSYSDSTYITGSSIYQHQAATGSYKAFQSWKTDSFNEWVSIGVSGGGGASPSVDFFGGTHQGHFYLAASGKFNMDIGNTTELIIGGSLATFVGDINAKTFSTTTNCADSAGAAACGAASAGRFVLDAAATTVVVSTTVVTANSEIFISEDASLGTALSVTCNTTPPVWYISARTAGASFTLTATVAPATNPACFSYRVIN